MCECRRHQNRGTVRLWVEIVGDKRTDRYTERHAYEFQAALRKMPQSHGKGGPVHALKAIEAAEASKNPVKRLAEKTIERHFSLLHRSYPEMARRLRQQGTVVVHFTVDREGHVLEVSLVHGSGTEALDQAAQELLRSAHLPAFPPDMKLSQQSVTVPIRYRLE